MKLRLRLLFLLSIELILIIVFSTSRLEDDISYKIYTGVNKNLLNASLDYADELKLSSADKAILKKDNNKNEVTFNMYKVSDGKNKTNAYLLSGVSTTFKTQSVMSESSRGSTYINYILYNSYPNVSLEEMGVTSEEEAYFATKYALAYMTLLSGENNRLDEAGDLYSMHEAYKKHGFDTNVFKVAERLISYSRMLKYDDVSLSSKIILDNSRINISLNNGRAAFGPFKITTNNCILDKTDLQITDRNSNKVDYTLLDRNGRVIGSIVPNNDFYIAFDKNINYVNANFSFNYYLVRSYIYKMKADDGLYLDFVVPIRTSKTTNHNIGLKVDKEVINNEASY